MTTVAPRLSSGNRSGNGDGDLFIVAAAEGSQANPAGGRRVKRREREREKGEDLRTPTEHGYSNDSIMHWIHSVAANQRNYQPPPRPGLFLVALNGRRASYEAIVWLETGRLIVVS